MKKNIIILIVVCGIIGVCYLLLNYMYIRNTFQNPEPTRKQDAMNYAPFVFAGYHEIYDYVVSSELIKHINNQVQLTTVNQQTPTDVISFESIPRVYIYVSESTNNKIHLVFTKLKKSKNLISLYNKQIDIKNLPEKDIDKTVILPEDMESGEAVRNSITDEQYSTVMSLIKKYDFSSAKIQFDNYLPDIKMYIQYMLLTNPGFMYNIMLTDDELTELELTRDKVTPQNAVTSLPLNPGFEEHLTKKNSTKGNMFTALLNNRNLVPVVDKKIHNELMKQSASEIESTIKKYLFKNNLMATNINMKRIALFKMNIVNPYQVHIFYMLKDSFGNSSVQDELSNKELDIKFSKVFTPDLSPEKLAKYAELSNANPKQKITYNPDRECFVLVNKFQIYRVVLKKKESEL